MKNRIGNRIKGLGMTAFLLVGTVLGNWGQLSEIRAEGVENTGIILKQEASWTDRGNYRAQITMEVSGLTNGGQGQEKAVENTTENAAEQSFHAYGALENEYDVGGGEPPEVPEAGEAAEMPEAAGMPGAQEPPESLTQPVQAQAAQEQPTQEPLAQDQAAQEQTAQEPLAQDQAAQDQTAQEPPAQQITGQEPGLGAFQASGENMQLTLINYISEYFQPDVQSLPEGCTWEEVLVNSQKGSQTTLTKIVYPIDTARAEGGSFSLTIPVILREEYRISGKAVSYPVSQDAPLAKDCTSSAGTFIQQASAGGESQSVIVAEAASPVLEVAASKGDFAFTLQSVTDTPKAGQELIYEVTVTNTGSLALSGIYMEGVFSGKGLSPQWELTQGIEADGNGAVIAALGAGESKTFQVRTLTGEDHNGDISFTVTASAVNPVNTQEKITRKQTVNTYVTPLKIDFTVEKTANRTIAVPGDTITYQICIRNTGERTLHSVVSTERLLGAGVQAEFVGRTGVTLNTARTQALIPQISPGEAFALEAVVTLPLNFTSRELINQVTVVSEETGNRTVQSQANVTVQAPQATASPTPVITGQGYYQSGGGKKSGAYNGYSPSSYPKTGDTSRTGFFAVLLLFSALSAAGVFWHRKGKRKH